MGQSCLTTTISLVNKPMQVSIGLICSLTKVEDGVYLVDANGNLLVDATGAYLILEEQ